MNIDEFNGNPYLDHKLKLDLNTQPILPFPDAQFDATVCTVSIDYLTQPEEVFSEIERVLKPGGVFILTFSNRCFQSKAVSVWCQCHEFERIGLILEYFFRNDNFDMLHTMSLSGLPRPKSDKYAEQISEADPVYAVWGQKILNHG